MPDSPDFKTEHEVNIQIPESESHARAGERETSLLHSPETGLYDIKPLDIRSNTYTFVIPYICLAVLLLISWYIYKRFYKKSLRQMSMPKTPPDITFRKTLSDLESHEKELELRALCESLSTALRILLSAYYGKSLTSLSANQVSDFLKKTHLEDTRIFNSAELLSTSEEAAHIILTLEDGTYGDKKTITSLLSDRAWLLSRTKEIGERIISLLKESAQQNKKNAPQSKKQKREATI